ncbi:MAG TPA: phytanoyl-CoA dioxygenase family protein [Allosphingosinicella sp.]|jgi:hypothetical protein
MQLGRDGAEHFPGALASSEVSAILEILSDRAGSARLAAGYGLSAFLAPADRIAGRFLSSEARAVGAKFFDKSAHRNWSLGWHQDRTIPVRERREVPGFCQWTVKSGIHHCVPPFELLERMLTLRIHLDAAGADNAPLLIAPGSHRLGTLRESDIATVVSRCGIHACLAKAGDLWAYATPILHASARAESPARRRVLQLLYSADKLPGGLEWLGV